MSAARPLLQPDALPLTPPALALPRPSPPPQCFWPAAPHFLRPVKGRYTFANMHALGLTNVLCAWVRPDVSLSLGVGALRCARLARLAGCMPAAGAHPDQPN